MITPTTPSAARAEWEQLEGRIARGEHYLDEVLGEIKRDAYTDLVATWVPGGSRRILKTDLFEEACGPDELVSSLVDRFDRVVGMDLSLATAARASRRVGGSRTSFLVADVRRLPFRDGSLPTVLSPSTLDHFRDPSDLGLSLHELRRCLAADGHAVVTLDNRRNVFDPLLRLVKCLGLVPFFLGRSYRSEELRSEMEAAGFAVTAETAIVHSPRLLATGSVWLARRSGSRRLLAWVHAGIRAMQSWGEGRWCYRTGCFIAALGSPAEASRPAATGRASDDATHRSAAAAGA
ncbi:MAG: class I SAM-dependent methyltransferase [Thermoanaerobaculia bacterium]|nr:class I SAM-dependent methyltransferase [Thermoanaerobaculia bacterium]